MLGRQQQLLCPCGEDLRKRTPARVVDMQERYTAAATFVAFFPTAPQISSPPPSKRASHADRVHRRPHGWSCRILACWVQTDTVRRVRARGHCTPRARARAFLYPTRVFQPCGPAITGDGTGAYIVTIVHGERDAPDGARFLHSDVEGEPPDPVNPCNTGCSTEPVRVGN